MRYDQLTYRRQFLMTSGTCSTLQYWQHKAFGIFTIYAHPDVELTVVEGNSHRPGIALIGYMIDPSHPERSNADIVNDMCRSTFSLEAVCRYLYDISGRFVLVVHDSKDTFVFHDACGLRSVFYSKEGGNVHLGSQPWILKEVMPFSGGERFISYEESDYRKTTLEHWIPSGCSLFDGISHLVPNHYLRLSDLGQIRYWPDRRLQPEPLEVVSKKASHLLENNMKAANARFPLALSQTAGLDSRTLLSASKAIAQELYFYTLEYRKLSTHSNDVAIPKKLLRRLGYPHHVIDCRKDSDPEYDTIYEHNSPMAHIHDWGDIAYGMMAGGYPAERVAVKGSCSEICRCFYHDTGVHPPIESPEQLIELERGWSGLPFVREQVSLWFDKAKPVAEATGVDVLDLFYWEHRMGSWQAQSQLEWDIVQEVFTPFNHRRLLETMLHAPTECRCAPHYVLYRKMCEALWPQVLVKPINPPTARDLLRNVIIRAGLEQVARTVYLRFAGSSVQRNTVVTPKSWSV